MSSLLNKRQVKQFALGATASTRAHSLTRVGSDAQCDAHLRQFITNDMQRLPSNGKTIR